MAEKTGRPEGFQTFGSSLRDAPGVSADIIDFVNKELGQVGFKGITAGPGIIIEILDSDLDIHTTPNRKIKISTTGVAGPGEANTASNLGAGSGLFSAKTGVDLKFKSLRAGSNISLSSTSTEVTITGTGEANLGTNLGGGTGIFAGKTVSALEFKSLIAGSGTSITSSPTEITISSITTGTVTGVFTSEGVKGGPITSTGTITLDVTGLAPLSASPDSADELVIFDTSGGSHKKITVAELAGALPAPGDPDQDIWETVTADEGSTVANTTTDNLLVLGGTGISTAIVGDTLTITNTAIGSGDPDQDVFVTFASDAGLATANTTTDTLTIAGGTGISTSVSGDVLTVTATGGAGSQDLWETVTADEGSTTANTTTDTLTVAGGTNVTTSITGDTLTINATGASGDPDQNLWETITANTGSTIANTITDNLSILGGTGVSTTIVGDTLTIDGSTGTVTQVGSGEGLSGGPFTTSGSLKLDVGGLAEITSVDTAADFLVVLDDTDNTHKKVKPNNLGLGGGGATTTPQMYVFGVTFNAGGGPINAFSLPSGWGFSVGGSVITITHTVSGKHPRMWMVFGDGGGGGGGTVFQSRPTSAAIDMEYDTTVVDTFTLNGFTSFAAGALTSGTAQVTVMFL